ncbi:MAG: ABC transporter permease [Gammaproteobacteria bacterium]|nr:ABC transporter permease [Gammaproteobacteria bacterium]MCH9744516.1 ABC transporter permease [Gammaproteobacteria bacterium]
MLPSMFQQLLEATGQTLLMVFVSTAVAGLLGLPLGVLLLVTRHRHILQGIVIHRSVAMLVNGLRSIPFIILMVAIIPFTRLIVGTSIGTAAAMVPLAVAAIPFFARIVENSLSEVPQGLIEASQAMGATPLQIIIKVLIPESLSGIIRGFTLTAITLVGYSAMAGAVGGGGLGDLAIRYGYQRFEIDVMLETIAILIVVVQLIQFAGDWCSRKMTRG